MTRLQFASDGHPRDHHTWSGSPARLIAALDSRGVVVDALDVGGRAHGSGLGWHIDRLRALVPAVRAGGLRVARRGSYNIALASPRVPRERARRHAEATAGLLPASGLLQTSGYVNPDAAPTIVLTDMTFRQAVRYDWKGYAFAPASWKQAGELHDQEVFTAATACCAASSWAARSIIDDYGVPAEKVHVVGLGASASSRPETKDWATPRFAFVGFDWERKNGALVLECFGRLLTRSPTAELDLVGDHPPVSLPGVRGHGILPWQATGDSAGVVDIMKRATCLVLPSTLEPFGLVHVEAGAVGVPSIGTTRGGASDAIGSGGVLVSPGDGAGLLSALEMMADPITAQRLGAEARLHAATLTWDAVAGRILDILLEGPAADDELVSGRPRG